MSDEKIHTITFTETGIAVSYVKDFNTDSMVLRTEMVEVPQEVIPTSLLEELNDWSDQFLELIRVLERQPVDQFRAPR